MSSRPIFRFSLTALNYKLIKKSHYLAFSTQIRQTTFSSYHSRRHDYDSFKVRVSVWWDFENCNLPSNTNVCTVGQRIRDALRANGIYGPIRITAFGDVMQLSSSNQEALSSGGIIINHVPSESKDSADKSLLVDLMDWVSDNPPPAHLFLISGDRDFAKILHRLRMKNYNILLAGPDSTPGVLCSAATIMWQWSSLLKGENLRGRLFNYPPGDPFNSCYGQYHDSLEDPFADKSCRSIPKEEVMNRIHQILNSYPEGLPISLLRIELYKAKLPIDKDLYGYKKFSRFLSAMPHIVKLDVVEDKIFARGVNSKFVHESVPATKSETSVNNEEFENLSEKSTVSAPKVRAQLTNSQQFQNEEKKNLSTSSMSMQGMEVKAAETNSQDLRKEEKQKESPLKTNMQEKPEQDRNVKLQEQQKKVEVASPIVEIKEFSENKENRDVSSDSSEFGMLKRMWMKLFGSRDSKSSDKAGWKSDETSGGKTAERDYVTTDVSRQDSGFFNPVMGWFKSWTSSESNDKVEKNAETKDQVKVTPKQLDLFSKESFWKEVESFIDTSDGVATFLQSRSRDHLVQNLQKQGPPVLKFLPKSDLHHLVNLLIKEKKWVEECEFQIFPFKCTHSAVGKDPHNNPQSSSNGLSHIFARRQANLQDPGERKHQNPPYTGVPQPVAHRGSSSKPRNEILADCQKIVDHIVKEYPEGFNMGGFRKLFLEKHDYALDLQKLGYEKLVNLLQMMSGVRIESNLILPAAAFKNLDAQTNDLPIREDKVHPVMESSLSTTKDDDGDSLWDELGPINEDKVDTLLTSKGPKGETEYDYELVGYGDFSDSDEETSPAGLENKTTKFTSNDESSLLQVLDSWYRDKGVDGKKNGATSITNTTDSEEMNGSPVINPTRKQKPVKSYAFVKEPVKTEDNLVHDILGNLKKSREKSTESRVSS